MLTTNIPPDYLHDESRRSGTAKGIVFPRSTAELQQALVAAQTRGDSVTIQGARTGISGGAVPDGSVIISLTRMTKIAPAITLNPDGRHTLAVQPGVTLSDLRDFLGCAKLTDNSRVIFPPDPTETSASIGGMTACNASGACSFSYGATRAHIGGIRVVLADGDTLTIKRNQHFATCRHFRLTTDQGRTIEGELPPYTAPSIKSAAGYWIKEGMDLIDLFIGSEGTLGVISEIELLLTPAPLSILGILSFFEGQRQALDFTEMLRERAPLYATKLSAIEYFDAGALAFIQDSAIETGLLLPPFKPQWQHAIYTEWAQSALPPDGQHLALVAEIMRQCGASAENTWLASDSPGLKRMKTLRHSVPEQINSVIAERKRNLPELTKLGTDLSVPNTRLHAVMELYCHGLQQAELEYAIFGHIGDNHVHVNILPRDMQQYARGKALYKQWAQQVVAWGGSVSAEHGIGQLKKELLLVMYGEPHIQAMRDLKALFDPGFTLNPGCLFDKKAKSVAGS